MGVAAEVAVGALDAAARNPGSCLQSSRSTEGCGLIHLEAPVGKRAVAIAEAK